MIYMHQFASGPGLAVGLATGDGPPLSPETVGRAPSFLEAPVPLHRPAEVTALAAVAAPPAQEPVEEPHEELLPPAADAGARRIVVRLLGGEEIELGVHEGRDAAVAAAEEVVALVAAAEAAGEWPELEGRFLRPASIASIDVLVEG
ncbi:MAG TPA: hypothetical protein VML35_03495 [Gaiellaceae bacterium]|nr:hypothetical protein [Gaiellaceae bacterium]